MLLWLGPKRGEIRRWTSPDIGSTERTLSTKPQEW